MAGERFSNATLAYPPDSVQERNLETLSILTYYDDTTDKRLLMCDLCAKFFIFPKNRSLAKLLTHRNTNECLRRVLNSSKKRVEAQERAKEDELREQLFELGWPSTNLFIYAYHFI